MGYEVEAFRYLMKRSLENSFSDNMNEIVKRLEMNQKQLKLATINGNVPIIISNLCYAESFGHLILFQLESSAVLESKQYTLTELSEILKPHSFLRIHKSFLVNPEHISLIKNRSAVMKNGGVLPCGKKDYTQTLKDFMLWKGGL